MDQSWGQNFDQQEIPSWIEVGVQNRLCSSSLLHRWGGTGLCSVLFFYAPVFPSFLCLGDRLVIFWVICWRCLVIGWVVVCVICRFPFGDRLGARLGDRLLISWLSHWVTVCVIPSEARRKEGIRIHICIYTYTERENRGRAPAGHHEYEWGAPPRAERSHPREVQCNTMSPASKGAP